MKLKNIDEIKKDGLVVFMPSGIQATLFNEDNNIVVKYYDLAEDKYTKEDFNKLIEEGIFIFNEPSQMIMEGFKENKEQKINESILDKLTKKGYIRESLAHQLKEEKDGRYVILIDEEPLGPVFKTREEAEEWIDTCCTNEPLEIVYDTEFDYDDLDEAFEQKDNKPGDVYTGLTAKEKEYLTHDYKLELLQGLDKIAKEYPNVPVRQQAQTFIDELGIQEYYDIKKVQQFIDKHIDIMNPTNESLKEELGEYANNAALQEIAQEILDGNKNGTSEEFGSWILETSLDDKWNALTNNAKDYILEHISYPVHDGHISYVDLELVLHEGSGLDYEDLESLKLFDDEQIGNILDNKEETAYISYGLKLQNAPDLEESFKVRKKKKKKIEDSLQEKLKVNEKIYLKDPDGNEIGPFEDQDAKDNYIKQQKQHGDEKEYEEIIKEEDMKNEAMNVLDQNIKTWYLGKYPKDELGEELNEVTFNELEKRMRAGEDVYDILGVSDSVVRERVFDFAFRYGDRDLYDLWLSMARINSNKKRVHEDCYKVYNNLDPDADAMCFDNWNEVEDHLQQQWGEYKASMAKENTEFGTEQDKEDYLNNFEVAIEPVEVPVEEIPAEGIELEVADVCPECNETPCVCEEPENTEDVIITEQPEEIAEPVEAPVADLEYIENYIQQLLDKAEEPEEEIQEMCMQKLPDVEDVKKQNKAAAEKEEKEDKTKKEDFSDNMGMLTDINDLDFPDALHDAVDTKEDGSLYRLSDLAKELQDVKSSIEQIKNDFKSELTSMIQDLKNDLKIEVNNVETKVQDTKSAVDNLTSEEEDLDMEEPMEEPAEQASEQEEPADEPEKESAEESFEDNVKGNALFENIKEIIATNKHPKKIISVKTIASRLREEYGVNANLNTQAGRAVYQQVANLVNNTSLKECVVDPTVEEAERKKAILGKAASWLHGGLMESMAKQKQLDENLAQIKAEIDKKVQAGANAEELNNDITLAAENEQEAKDAKQYAIDKLNSNAKTESLKSKLLGTNRSSVFSTMDFRG